MVVGYRLVCINWNHTFVCEDNLGGAVYGENLHQWRGYTCNSQVL